MGLPQLGRYQIQNGELPRGIKSPKTKVLTRQAAGNVPAEIQVDIFSPRD
jgi:hypothetical protein